LVANGKWGIAVQHQAGSESHETWGFSRPFGEIPSGTLQRTTANTARTKSKDWRVRPYFCNDGAMKAADGYYRILGRVDDVINVDGHPAGLEPATL
jgi:acyl-coenzyme A synthetase/AMP-(fatty) acid ligase